jgi:hypothetical protein
VKCTWSRSSPFLRAESPRIIRIVINQSQSGKNVNLASLTLLSGEHR